MNIYFIIIGLAVAWFLVGGGTQPRRQQVIVFCSSMFFYATVAGLGDMLGGFDRYIYCELFDDVANQIAAGKNPRYTAYVFVQYAKEFGYGYFNVLIGHLTMNRYIFVLITTYVVFGLITYSMIKTSNNLPVAILLFLGMLYFFTFTYFRQILGVSICWLSFPFLLKRQPVPFFAIVALGATFHLSAAIFALAYFMPRNVIPFKFVVLFMIVCFALGLAGIGGNLFSEAGEMADLGKRAQGYVQESNQFRGIYVVEALVFLSIIGIGYRKLSDNPKDVMTLNVALLFCATLLLFCKSLSGGRLAWYFMIGIFGVVSRLIAYKGLSPALTKTVVLMCLVLYLRIWDAWGISLSPYKTFLTPGFRSGDIVHTLFEYDRNYDLNKFYR